MAVPPALVRVPSQRSLAPSVTSVRSVANDMGDNEIDDYGQISRDLPYDYGHANVDSRGNLMLFT